MKENRLDQGFDALLEENWQEADRIFADVLEADPQNGMACLGAAMAAYRIPSRRELGEQWDRLQGDPEFLRRLEAAKPDFLPWLRQDMKSISGPSLLSRLLADRCRWPLLLFAAVQVGLYLAVAVMIMKIGSDSGTFGIRLLGGLLISAMATGLPVILGPVYGNAIVKGSRFRRVMKLVNNLVSIPGSLLFAALTAAGYLELRQTMVPQREDACFTLTFFFVFLAYFLALIIPPFLRRGEQEEKA